MCLGGNRDKTKEVLAQLALELLNESNAEINRCRVRLKALK